MKSFLAGLFLLCLTVCGQIPNCDWTTQTAYYGVCVSKACIANNVKNLKNIVNFGPQLSGAPTQFGFTLGYDAVVGYSMTMNWVDGLGGNYWVGPNSCVTWRIYAQQDQFYGLRTFTKPDAASNDDVKVAPTWPTSAYSQTANSAQIVLTASQAEVQQNCLNDKNAPAGQAWYQCYFELAFAISGRTQVSVYFSFVSRVNAQTSASLSLTINQKKIVVSPLLKEIGVSSKLEACNTPNFPCAVAVQNLFVGDTYYVKQTITDPNFSKWVLKNPSLIFGSANQYGAPASFPVNNGPGYVTLGVDAELQSSGGTLYSTATAAPSRRILVTKNPKKNTFMREKVTFPKVLTPIGSDAVLSSDASFASGFTTPASLYSGALFYVQQTISDSKYASYKIGSPVIIIKGVFNKGQPVSPSFTVKSTKAGSVVYQFTAEVSSSDSAVQITGTLQTGGRILAAQAVPLLVRNIIRFPLIVAKQ